MPGEYPIYPAFGKQISNWFSHTKTGAKTTVPNIIRFAIRLEHVDTTLAKKAFELLVHKHNSLRTVFAGTPNGVVQVVAPYDHLKHALQHTCCRSSIAFDHKRRTTNYLIEQLFGNLEQGPLFKGVLYEVANSGYLLELSIHHILADAWSIRLIKKELIAMYAAIGAGKSGPHATVQLSDYAQQYLAKDQETHTKAYWQQKLRHLPAAINMQLFYDSYNAAVNADVARSIYRPPVFAGNHNIAAILRAGYGYTFSSFIKDDIIGKLNRVAVKYKTTVSIIVLTVFLVLMRRLYRTQETLIISRLNGRFDTLSQNIIGNFTCAVYSYINEKNSSEIRDLIEVVRQDYVDSLAHAVYNPQVVGEVPLTVNCHLCVNILFDDYNETDLSYDTLIKTPVATYFPLEVAVIIHKESIHFNWVYNSLLFRSSMLQFIAGEHRRLLMQAALL